MASADWEWDENSEPTLRHIMRRLETLEQRIKEIRMPDLTKLQAAVDRLDATQVLESQGEQAAQAAVDAITAHVDSVTTRLDAGETAPVVPAPAADAGASVGGSGLPASTGTVAGAGGAPDGVPGGAPPLA